MGFKKFRAFFLRSSFYKVILNVYEAIADFILRRTNLNKVGKDGKTPLYKAVFEESDYKRVARLVKNGADINAINKDGDTLLHIAADKESLKIVDLLIKNGADVNVSDENGDTPLHIAVGRGSLGPVDLLIKNGADVSTVNKNGDTLLHTTIRRQNGDAYRRLLIVLKLLAKGVDISAVNKNGITPLHNAVYAIWYGMVVFLIKSGADVNKADRVGDTPLNIAVLIYRYEPQEVTLSMVLIFMILLLLKNADTRKPDAINGEQSLSTLWDACKAEVDALNKLTFSSKSLGTLSLIDVCKEENENKLALIFQNKEVNKLIATLNLKEKYPHFANEIQHCLQIKQKKGLARHRALNTARKSIFNFNINKQLNEDCWREILKNLPQEDLKNVTKVASLFFKHESSSFEDYSSNGNRNVSSVMAKDDVQILFSRSI